MDKKCFRCDILKPIEFFYSDKNGKLYSYCKQCANEYSKKYYQKNRNYISYKAKQRRLQNPKKYKDHVSNWKKNNPDKFKLSQDAYFNSVPKELQFNHGKPWTTTDIQYLKTYMNSITNRELALSLGRSIRSIVYKKSMINKGEL